MDVMKTAYLGLGSDLGDRSASLRSSLRLIRENLGRILACSSVYETEPWGFSSNTRFLNMAIELETDLNPQGLLGRIMMVEAMLGRLREGKTYRSRVIDIDILFYDELCFSQADLTIPHPRLHERRFVLVPMSELAPGLIHPKLKMTISELLQSCSDACRVTLLGNIDNMEL
jgi:2-amino-4-hydroxy-6-hydroxymethyldihydropteridine diphosphokinase